jgi:methylaspartate mutase epsilon subunit
VHAVLELSDDVGQALLRAFARGILDVPYCLHDDNLGLSRGAIGGDGRLYWAEVGKMPLPAPARDTQRRVTSNDLLRMLRSTADLHDRAGLAAATQDAPSLPSQTGGGRPLRVAVVGSGPRGIAVLERLAARHAEGPAGTRIEVSLIDDAEVGCGRVWRTDQSPFLLMNTAAGEVTMFSGPPDGGPPRAGAGPSLAQWWATVDPDRADPAGYAPRALYGRYLRFVLDRIEAGLPGRFVLHRITARVEDLRRADSQEWVLALADGGRLKADRVVLATGHPVTEPQAGQRSLADFAGARRGLSYIRADGTEKQVLDRIPAGATVGVIGLGLSFYDLMAQVTLGRGGRFADDGSGGLRYLPSGREPVLVAGSRSGLPMPARGRNQKPSDHCYRPVLFTMDRIREARAARRLDFTADVLPFLAAEIDVVYCLTTARSRGDGGPPEQALRQDLAADVRRHGLDEAMRRFRERIGLTDLPALDLEALARPFQGRFFTSAADYHHAVRRWIDQDLTEAALGNVEGPLKAALDVLRDVRSVLRAAVEFSGLTPRSHEEDFLGRFVPVSSFLSTGPPMVRLAQTRALLDAGVLTLAGPQTRFGTGDETFIVDSPQVKSPARAVDILFDARVPMADLAADTSGLSRRLRARGVLTTYTNAYDGSAFPTGGVAVTPSFHPVGLNGPDQTLYLIGIPTEFTRWFTQVGSGRPQVWSGFTADADAIAADLLAVAPVPGANITPQQPAMLTAAGPA